MGNAQHKLQQHQQVDPEKIRRYLDSEMNVLQSVSGSGDVVGLTMLHQELFLLHERDENQVSVYSAPDSSTDLALLRQFTVKGLGAHWDNDMTSSKRSNCLYMSDNSNRCVHKVASNGAGEATFPIAHRSTGLSLTPNDNLLVICGSNSKLVELNSDNGHCVREIDLLSLDIQYPMHAVQLASHVYALTHGRWDTNCHGVCVADVAAKLSLSYVRKRGSDATQLNRPRHMTTDSDNFVFVADHDNHRLAVLSPSLRLLRHVYFETWNYPWRLYFDQQTRRLYVGFYTGNVIVTVIQL